MKYYVQETQSEAGVQRTAGIKARDDVETILNKNHYTPISIDVEQNNRKESNPFMRVVSHYKVKKNWDVSVAQLKKGDVLVIQFPIINHSLLLQNTMKLLRKKGVRVILLIHDLEILRAALRNDAPLKKQIRLKLEEKSILDTCDFIIAHNDKMKRYLVSLGIQEGKIVSLEIFDYLIPSFDEKYDFNSIGKDMPVIIAGTLRPHKARYVYNLPKNCTFNLFGVGYEGKKTNNITYFGSFPPDELPYAMHGSFGLVWDGDVLETCSGIYGEYLKINNPHKTSLYLASGIPVLIWSKAALADFVLSHGCGIVVDSLDDIEVTINAMSENEYSMMKKNALRVSEKLRAGKYTLAAIENCLNI